MRKTRFNLIASEYTTTSALSGNDSYPVGQHYAVPLEPISEDTRTELNKDKGPGEFD